MKIRHPSLLKGIAFAGASAMRLWMSSLRYRMHWCGPNLDPTRPGLEGRYIYTFWHEYLLLPILRYGRADIWALIGQHADGEVLADLCRYLRIRTIRGSTTRGGVQAIRKLVRASRKGHLAITPDGPRGPRRRVKPGLVYLAAQTGLPIVPAGIGYRRPWRLHSWDKFALPRPWSLATCVVAEPILVPPDAGEGELERYRLHVEESLHWTTEAAEQWAATDRRQPQVIRELKGHSPNGAAQLRQAI